LYLDECLIEIFGIPEFGTLNWTTGSKMVVCDDLIKDGIY
jgi:hypothetical protein